MRKEIYEKNGNQESSDTLPFHWEFGKEEITLKVSSYAYGNGLAVLMYSQSEGVQTDLHSQMLAGTQATALLWTAISSAGRTPTLHRRHTIQQTAVPQ